MITAQQKIYELLTSDLDATGALLGTLSHHISRAGLRNAITTEKKAADGLNISTVWKEHHELIAEVLTMILNDKY